MKLGQKVKFKYIAQLWREEARADAEKLDGIICTLYASDPDTKRFVLELPDGQLLYPMTRGEIDEKV